MFSFECRLLIIEFASIDTVTPRSVTCASCMLNCSSCKTLLKYTRFELQRTSQLEMRVCTSHDVTSLTYKAFDNTVERDTLRAQAPVRSDAEVLLAVQELVSQDSQSHRAGPAHLVAKGLATAFSDALLPSTQTPEVLCCLWCLLQQASLTH